MPIRCLVRFYIALQWDNKDPVHYRRTVTPKDADKILMRWKVPDSEYRVIYGDLHAETVSSERLAQLEEALLKEPLQQLYIMRRAEGGLVARRPAIAAG